MHSPTPPLLLPFSSEPLIWHFQASQTSSEKKAAEETHHGESKAFIKIQFQVFQLGSLCLAKRDLESGSESLYLLLVLQLTRCMPLGKPLHNLGPCFLTCKWTGTLCSSKNTGLWMTPELEPGCILNRKGIVCRLGGDVREAN